MEHGTGAVSEVLTRLEALVDCDMAATTRLGWAGGQWMHDGVVVRGGGAARAAWLAAQGTASVVPWDPEHPTPSDVDRFKRTIQPSAAAALGSVAVYARFYLPFDLTSDARALIYDGDRFVCWVGLLRADAARPFRDAELRRLNRAAPSVAAALVAIDRRRIAGEHAAPADLVFHADGALEVACRAGRALVDEGRGPELASLVRRADRHGVAHALVGGRAVHVTPLEGPGGTRYLVNVRATRRPRVSAAAQLSARQREIAALAACGATSEEIAGHLAIGRETVREHLRRIYVRLGLSNRMELARVLERGPP